LFACELSKGNYEILFLFGFLSSSSPPAAFERNRVPINGAKGKLTFSSGTRISFLDQDLEGIVIGKSVRQIFSKVFTDIHRRGHLKTSIQNRLGDFLIQCTLQSLYECRNSFCSLRLDSFTLTNGCN
jgi:hypothetical protein